MGIVVIDDILEIGELEKIKSLIKEFKEDSVPDGQRNYYHRMSVDEKLIQNSIQNIIYTVEDKIGLSVGMNGLQMWINRVTPQTNIGDVFHTDACYLSLVIFINEGYKGGGLQWYDTNGGLDTIVGKENRGVFIHNHILHRVEGVKDGERYTLVLFLKDGKSKTEKSLI
jgi:hypothetical protein